MQAVVSRFGGLRRRFAASCGVLAVAGVVFASFLFPLSGWAASGPESGMIRDTPKYDKALLRKENAAASGSKTQSRTSAKTVGKKSVTLPPKEKVPGQAASARMAKPGKAAAAARPAPAPTAASAAPSGKITFPVSRVTPFSPEMGATLAVNDTWLPLLRRLNQDGVDLNWLRAMFGRMGDAYSHEPMGAKVTELFTSKYVPRPPRKTPAKHPAAPPVYTKMVTPENLEKCKAYLETHKKTFAAMEERYGVPKEVVAGLLMVETRLGTFLGHNSSFWSLACMAAADSPERVSPALEALPLPMTPDKEQWLRQTLRERSSWAYKELLALIRHSMDNELDPLGLPGSVYGAIGICQFMPSNLTKFAVDGNRDGKVDLFDPADAIPSVANYLKENGWAGREIIPANRAGHHQTLKRYNKSNVYANTILAIAEGVAAPEAVYGTGATTAPQAKQAVRKQGAAKKTTGKPAGKTSAKKQHSGKPAKAVAAEKSATQSPPKSGTKAQRGMSDPPSAGKDAASPTVPGA